MIGLLDVNVLVALAWPNHVHHERAHRWLATHQEAGWATCPLTQSGFVRVSSNASVMPEARKPQEAIALLQRIIELPDHVFWEDDVSLATSRHVARERLHGYRQVSDAHLLALALRRGGCLVSFDRGILSLVPSGIEPDQAVLVLV